jgi:hypothetical protein
VAQLLDRLTGTEQPYGDVEEVQAALIELQGEPTEVNTALRSGHIALLVAVLVPILVLMLGVRYAALHQTLHALYERVALEYTAVEELKDEAKARKLFADRALSERVRRKSPKEWAALLERRLARDQERWQALRQVVRFDWLSRFLLAEAYWRPDINPVTLTNFTSVDLERALLATRADRGAERDGPTLAFYALILGPAGWCVLWAFLTRGGWAFGLVGLSLRRASGRRAWRTQCAWRALLFWSPVAALLVLSLWVQTQYPERQVLAFGLWCSALAVLLGYMLLALWFPTRSLHDRLAGTYLVPK